jgi:hypothetical protein
MFKLKTIGNIKYPSHGLIIADKNMSYPEYLELGEFWEEVLARNLNDIGLSAYRPKQNFHTPQDKKRIAKGLKPLNKLDSSIYSKQQRDILIRFPGSPKRICLEVKSRVRPFNYSCVDVGKIRTWMPKSFLYIT